MKQCNNDYNIYHVHSRIYNITECRKKWLAFYAQ